LPSIGIETGFAAFEGRTPDADDFGQAQASKIHLT